jgi:hypothetical protein
VAPSAVLVVDIGTATAVDRRSYAVITTTPGREEQVMSYEAIYDGVRYPFADAAAAHGLEEAIRGIFDDNGAGGFVGFVSQNSTVRLLITPVTPIAIRGSGEPVPGVVYRW